jgi:hypothetical protein
MVFDRQGSAIANLAVDEPECLLNVPTATAIFGGISH